ncbi:flavin reductase like domain-containing protein [Boeremia exigua]|uniref:flavin reductase like domain-containing protein n=1 Tax=Boeremia exigua TaxID=749465 RepID=UPI001E8DA21D|nr:flavin reductase like domain-containing protein [Boeremia exigua]KAH6637573.1 flavin reductase like domain-containing protein [Boeremia exigua]
MALAQRPGSRFFAAFYRWSRHTQRASPCTFSSQSGPLSRRSAAFGNVRSYHATRCLREEEQSTNGFTPELGTSAATQGDSQASVGAPAQAVGSAELKEEVRRLMRKVPASVAVITVAHVDPETRMDVPMGIVVSSLSTVTLDPPTISFNIKEPSQALTAIRNAHGCFRVHWMDAQKSSLGVIERFCNGNHPEAYKERLRQLHIDIPSPEANATATASLAPQIREPTVRAAAECTLTHELPVGDHVILVARITNLECSKLREPTIAYVDGAYRRIEPKGMVGTHQPATTQQTITPPNSPSPSEKKIKSAMSRAHELSIAYDWPVVPGDRERHEYAKRLRLYIEGLPLHRRVAHKRVIEHLQSETKQLSRSLGINLTALVNQAYIHHGLGSPAAQEVLPEFYGTLSSAQLAKLRQRVTQVVETDQRFLEVSYFNLLGFLSVHNSASVLPSDLTSPLRAKDLLPPFEPPTSSIVKEKSGGNLVAMEVVEHFIRDEISRLKAGMLNTNLVVYFNSHKLRPKDFEPFRASLTRLTVETCPSFNTEWKHDIAGEITTEEAQVVIRRLVEYMIKGTHDDHRMRNFEATDNILRQVGVHPLIIGLNADFVISKLRYLTSISESSLQLRSRFEHMVRWYFARNVTWTDLQSRFEQFVQKFPMRAITWPRRDVLAAVGLSGRTTISTPLTETPRTIDESNLFDTLLAKALTQHYGNGTDEENQAIASFLKDRFGFDVTQKSATVTPEQALERSSADDLDAALSQYRAETVPIRDFGT